MLKIKNIHINYGVIEAVKGVSLDVSEGEIVTLVGANGAGKSTLLKAISGLVDIKEGDVEYVGSNINKTLPKDIVRRGISHVPEGRRIFPQLTVLENLEMGAILRKNNKEIKEDLEKIYSRFPILKERHSQLAGTLSGGEQQMLALGRALMSRPKLLLLDEPSMGLAPIYVKEIFKIIKDINETGTTILLVEQNANMALSIAHRGYVLENGRVVAQGSGKELSSSDEVRNAYLGV